MRTATPSATVSGMRSAAHRLSALTKEYWLDALIVVNAVVLAFDMAFGFSGDTDRPTGHTWALMLATLPVCLPLLARRRYPFGAPAFVFLYLTAVSFVNGTFVAYPFSDFLAALAACALFGMLRDWRQSVVGLGIALGASVIVGANDPSQTTGDYVWTGTIFAIFWLAGFGLGLEAAAGHGGGGARCAR